MQQFDIFIDINSGQVVTSLTNPAAGLLPAFIQNDTLSLRIWLLVRNAGFGTGAANPYSLLNTAGLSLQVTIGDKNSNANNWYTQQFVWATDANNQYFYAQLPLNTAAITTLINAAGNVSAQSWLEVKIQQADGTFLTVLQQQITIQASIDKPGGLVVPAGQTPISMEFAKATFLPRAIVGAITWEDPNTGKTFSVYPGDDGALHCDALN
ncbi:MAG TPA: hypothetical protein VG028_13455 [Terriglobia bacterium]|nr:hypothetical protein [Terriglobia bacterium]